MTYRAVAQCGDDFITGARRDGILAAVAAYRLFKTLPVGVVGKVDGAAAARQGRAYHCVGSCIASVTFTAQSGTQIKFSTTLSCQRKGYYFVGLHDYLHRVSPKMPTHLKNTEGDAVTSTQESLSNKEWSTRSWQSQPRYFNRTNGKNPNSPITLIKNPLN